MVPKQIAFAVQIPALEMHGEVLFLGMFPIRWGYDFAGVITPTWTCTRTCGTRGCLLKNKIMKKSFQQAQSSDLRSLRFRAFVRVTACSWCISHVEYHTIYIYIHTPEYLGNSVKFFRYLADSFSSNHDQDRYVWQSINQPINQATNQNESAISSNQ